MTDTVKKVMVIDDDHALLAYLDKQLSAFNCQVETVDRGATGLQKLLVEDFDLVLIDNNMPEISGPAICQALRKHDKTRDLKVVMVTSVMYTPDQIEKLKADYGPDDFLLKPFTVDRLQEVVGRALGFPAKPKQITKEPCPLSECSIPEILHCLYSEKATGLLHLQRGKAKKIIYLNEGYPIFARSNVISECLGRMLVKNGVITQVDCDESVERIRESKRLQGTVLIEMGLLTPEGLQEALTHQVTEKLLSTFKWQTGTARFDAGKDFKKNATSIKLSPATLIMQGIKLHWSPKRLDEFLEPYRNLYLVPGSNLKYQFQDVELNRRGKEIFRNCRGTLTLNETLQQYPLARLEAQQVLAGLLISELIETSEAPKLVATADRSDDDQELQVDDDLRRKILNDYKRLMEADYFEALGVARQCSSPEVRRAYYRLAKEYHPDRFLGMGLSREMNNKIHAMFQYITQAYTVLSDKDSHADYLDELVNGPKKTIDVNQVIEAEGAFQEGRAMLKVRRYKEATKPLKRAIELSPEEPEYLTGYAWALFKSDPENPAVKNQALEILIASRELNPELDTTHLYLGHVYQAQGKERQSEKAFEMAVQANPSCTEALRELRLINLRREQSTQPKGLLKKFIHKDDD